MEITFGGGTLAEVGHSDAIVTSDTEVVAGARGLRYLGAERGGYG